MSDRPIDRWKALRSSGSGDGAVEVPSLSSRVETGFGPVRFAVGPEGQPRLLVPCGPGGALSGVHSTDKLAITLSRFTLAGQSTMFIDVMSLDRALDPVFGELADEILHRIDGGATPVGAVEGTVTDFRELLREGSRPDVTDSVIFGLIGELVILRSLARIAPSAIEAWTGPYEQRHDFRRREHALEVKTSSRADATSVSISSCDQLAEPSGGSLSLAHMRVERADMGELSIAGLADEITDCGVRRDALEKGLSTMGCLDPDSSEWNRIRCSLEGVACYRVVAGFPRIVSGQFPGGVLPDGIESIVYSIDLRSAQPFLLSDVDRDSAFQRIVV